MHKEKAMQIVLTKFNSKPFIIGDDYDGLESFNLLVKCTQCKTVHKVPVTLERLVDWLLGKYIQDAFSELTFNQRELLISGICPSCWDEMFQQNDSVDSTEDNLITV